MFIRGEFSYNISMSRDVTNHENCENHFCKQYQGINKSLRWAAVEDLRIHRKHLLITQEEVNKQSKSKVAHLSLSLNNRSSCANGHVRLTFCSFPWAMSNELLFSFCTRRKLIQSKSTEDLQHKMALKPAVFEASNIGYNSSTAGAKTCTTMRSPEGP
jgi:hypothetical protein